MTSYGKQSEHLSSNLKASGQDYGTMGNQQEGISLVSRHIVHQQLADLFDANYILQMGPGDEAVD